MSPSPGPPPVPQLAELFDHLPMVCFYAKDRAGVFLRCNRRFEEFHSLPPGGAIGLTDHDLHPPEIAGRYRAEDKRVMASGRPLPNRAWLVPDSRGTLHWWISTKMPLRDADGRVRGIAGAMYEISSTAGLRVPFDRVGPALDLIHADPSAALRTATLAAACHYSPSQFNRLFRQLLGQSPQQYILHHRLETAKSLLVRSDLPLSEIAVRVGFYDASVLGRKFREHEGVTPRQYRLRLREMIHPGEGGD